MNKRVLFVLTNHVELGATGEFTGYHLAEASRPYNILKAQGVTIDFASPQGGKPIPDAFDLDDPDNKKFWEDSEVQGKLSATLTPETAEASLYDGIYFPGGHGTMWDFRHHLALQELTRDIYEQGGFVAAVCHGPAALVDVKLSQGNYLVAGKHINAFTDEEERQAGLEDVVPFLLESALRERGAIFESSAPGECHVVLDGRIITGQNPASAKSVAKKMLSLMEQMEYRDAEVSHSQR